MKNEKNTTVNWINIGKFIAIAAVIVDHTFVVGLYRNWNINLLTYFSVSLFILLSGVTSYYSCERNFEKRGLKETFRRIRAIFIPYMAATAAYKIIFRKAFSLQDFWDSLLRFPDAYYFVLFYIQLIFIAPYLFDLIRVLNSKKLKLLWHIISVIAVGVISYCFVLYTLISEASSGGALHLFGGTYLLLFYLGMVFASTKLRFTSIIRSGVCALFSLILVILWAIAYIRRGFFADANMPFGITINPPGFTLMIYGLLIFAFVFCAISFIELTKNKILITFTQIISALGKYTLFIYLFHITVRIFLATHFEMLNETIWMKRLVYFSAMIFIPVGIKYLYDKASSAYKKALEESRCPEDNQQP